MTLLFPMSDVFLMKLPEERTQVFMSALILKLFFDFTIQSKQFRFEKIDVNAI